MEPTVINPIEFDTIVRKVREFFHSKGLIESHNQHKLSILAACEDPTTIAIFNYAGKIWPLPQTGQMHLEEIILSSEPNPNINGYFCITTSFREEKNPVKGRHDLIFPMIEFEIFGGMDKLEAFQREMLEYLGFGNRDEFPSGNYLDLCQKYGVTELDHAHEKQIQEEYGPVFFLKNFPETTSPFWNMERNNDKDQTAKKIDVIVCGIETFGSASRSCDVAEMSRLFHTISDGGYASLLYEKFGKDRVEAELDTFLKHTFVERSGCGIGFTRLLRAFKELNLL